MKKLIEKYKDLIPYAVFGVLTTLVNIGSYWLFAHPLHLPVMASTILAWIMSVLFAYLTNRKWVFHSEADTKEAVYDREGGCEYRGDYSELHSEQVCDIQAWGKLTGLSLSTACVSSEPLASPCPEYVIFP